jgi:heat shock protein HtpX
MYADIAANKRRTIFILFFFIVFIGVIIWLFSLYLGGSKGILVGGLIAAVVYAVITYYSGSRMALAVNGAKELQKSDDLRLWRIVENLSITDGLPMPRVFRIDDPAPNAFATGRDPKHAAVCVTTGLLQIMDDDELQGVLAHELSHIKNYDIRVTMVAFALSAVISLLADVILRLTWFRGDDRDNNNQAVLILGIVAAILAPFVALLIQMAVSRQREYLADATGALTTRYPEGLASALRKIEQTGSSMRKQNTATAHLFFANPLRGHAITNLFSTHPPIQDRIKRLEAMNGQA